MHAFGRLVYFIAKFHTPLPVQTLSFARCFPTCSSVRFAELSTGQIAAVGRSSCPQDLQSAVDRRCQWTVDDVVEDDPFLVGVRLPLSPTRRQGVDDDTAPDESRSRRRPLPDDCGYVAVSVGQGAGCGSRQADGARNECDRWSLFEGVVVFGAEQRRRSFADDDHLGAGSRTGSGKRSEVNLVAR